MKYLLLCIVFLCGCQQQLPKISDITAFVHETNQLAEELKANPVVMVDPNLAEAIGELVETTKDNDSTDWAYLGLAGLLGATGLIKRKK